MEHLKLNEEILWAGASEDPFPEKIRMHYSRYRDLAMQQKFQQEWDFGMKNLVFRPTSFWSYEPLGDLYIQQKCKNNWLQNQNTGSFHTDKNVSPV